MVAVCNDGSGIGCVEWLWMVAVPAARGQGNFQALPCWHRPNWCVEKIPNRVSYNKVQELPRR